MACWSLTQIRLRLFAKSFLPLFLNNALTKRAKIKTLPEAELFFYFLFRKPNGASST